MEAMDRTRRKSHLCRTTLSNIASQPRIDLSNVSRIEILSIKPKTVVDILRERFPVSNQGRPSFGFKRWFRLPVTADLLHYSRGRMGLPLIQGKIPNFTLYNERILSSSYNSLHDPGCINFFMIPRVRRMLEREGFVTKTGNVLCSLREIQQFHQYLVEISNSWINQFFMEKNCRDLYEIEQRKILTSPRKIEDKSHKKSTEEVETVKNKSTTKRPTSKSIINLRDQAFQKKMELKKVQLIEKGLERDMHLQLVALKCRDLEMENRRQLLLKMTMKDITAHLRIENNAIAFDEKKQLRDIEWIAAKVKFSSEHTERENALMEALAEDRRLKAIQRQNRVERYRKELSSWVTIRRKTMLYLWSITKKYFYIWLFKTRERKARRRNIDTSHTSVFIGRFGKPDPAAEAVMDVERELQNEGMTSFFLSVMRIRRAFRRPDDSLASSSINSIESTPISTSTTASSWKSVLNTNNKKASASNTVSVSSIPKKISVPAAKRISILASRRISAPKKSSINN